MDFVQYAFFALSADASGERMREFKILFFDGGETRTNQIEVLCNDNNRRFVNKSDTRLRLKDVFVGGTIIVNTRQFFVKGFADRATASALRSLRQRALLMVPPREMKRLGHVVSAVDRTGLIVAAFKTVRLDDVSAKRWVSMAHDMDSVDETVLSKGALSVVMEIRGRDAMSALSSLAKSVHVSVDAEAAEKEIAFFFDPQSAPSCALASTAMFEKCSLCLIKPHIVAEGRSGDIIQSIVSAEDIEMSACERVQLTKEDCAEFLESYSFLKRHSEHIFELYAGPCVAMEVRGEDVVRRLRDLAGPHDAVIAREIAPKSIRAQFGHNQIRNAVHVTDLETDGAIESRFVFSK